MCKNGGAGRSGETKKTNPKICSYSGGMFSGISGTFKSGGNAFQNGGGLPAGNPRTLLMTLASLPKMEEWIVGTCAECHCLKDALSKGAKPAEIRIKIASDSEMGNYLEAPCANCSQWLEQDVPGSYRLKQAYVDIASPTPAVQALDTASGADFPTLGKSTAPPPTVSSSAPPPSSSTPTMSWADLAKK